MTANISGYTVLKRLFSGTTAAMNFKLGMNILALSCYTCYELQAPPIFGVGGASARRLHSKLAVLYLTLVAHHSGQEACPGF